MAGRGEDDHDGVMSRMLKARVKRRLRETVIQSFTVGSQAWEPVDELHDKLYKGAVQRALGRGLLEEEEKLSEK
jgi:hypothetical protein